jgi:hypothetical protein
MDPKARGELLIAYAKGPAALKAALAQLPEGSLEFRPGPGRWTIQEIVFHLAESEVHGYLRGRTIIAEPGGAVLAFDQDRWVQSLDVADQPLDEGVDLFRLLREMLARQLRSLPEATWAQHVQHSERGRITLEAWLEGYVGHLQTHLAQIARNLEAFRAARG